MTRVVNCEPTNCYLAPVFEAIHVAWGVKIWNLTWDEKKGGGSTVVLCTREYLVPDTGAVFELAMQNANWFARIGNRARKFPLNSIHNTINFFQTSDRTKVREDSDSSNMGEYFLGHLESLHVMVRMKSVENRKRTRSSRIENGPTETTEAYGKNHSFLSRKNTHFLARISISSTLLVISFISIVLFNTSSENRF